MASLAGFGGRRGGWGVVLGAGSWMTRGAASVPVPGATEVVVGLATAAGWAGLSRPTTKAVVTPTATASTPAAAAARRMWA